MARRFDRCFLCLIASSVATNSGVTWKERENGEGRSKGNIDRNKGFLRKGRSSVSVGCLSELENVGLP